MARFSPTIFTLPFLLFPLGAIGADLKEICGTLVPGVEQVCAQVVELPTVTQKFCRTCTHVHVACKTKRPVRERCGLNCDWRGCTMKYCQREVCEPGTEEQCRNTPCGHEWTRTKTSICSPKVSPGITKAFMNTKMPACHCIHESYVMMEQAKESLSSGTLDADATRSLDTFLGNHSKDCDRHMGPAKTNRKEVLGNLFEDAGSDVLVVLPEIDATFYKDIALKALNCQDNPESGCEGLQEAFVKYVDTARTALKNGIENYAEQLVKGFQTPLQDTEILFKTVGEILHQDLMKVSGVCPVRIQYDHLPDLETFTREFDQLTLDSAETLFRIAETIQAIPELINNMPNLTLTTLNINEVKKVLDIPATIRRATENDPTLQELQDDLVDLASSLDKVDGYIRGGALYMLISQFERGVKDVPDCSWKFDANNDPLTPFARMHTRYNLALEKMNAIRLRGLTDKLRRLASTPGGIRIAGVATYSNWHQINGNYPCRISGEICRTDLGCLNYPKYFNCLVNQKVPMPNNYVPFLRLMSDF